MSEIKDLKCQCCKCWDNFDGCQAFDCDVDYEVSIQRVKEAAKEYGMSIDAITEILLAEETKRMEKTENKNEPEEEDILPEDFDPVYDSRFLVYREDVPCLMKRLLVDMETDELKRLRAEINFVLGIKEARGDA